MARWLSNSKVLQALLSEARAIEKWLAETWFCALRNNHAYEGDPIFGKTLIRVYTCKRCGHTFWTEELRVADLFDKRLPYLNEVLYEKNEQVSRIRSYDEMYPGIVSGMGVTTTPTDGNVVTHTSRYYRPDR